FVGEAARDQARDNLDHTLDVIRGTREDVGGKNVDALLVAGKLFGIPARNVLWGETCADRLTDALVRAPVEQVLANVSNVGDVLDVAHTVSVSNQQTFKPVSEQV